MSERLVVFEDERWADLRPLTDLVAVPALRFGAGNLGDRWIARLGIPSLGTFDRDGWHAAEASHFDPTDTIVAANAAALPGRFREQLASGPHAVFTSGGRVVGARFPAANLGAAIERGRGFATCLEALGLPAVPVEASILARPWHLIEWNAGAIAEDLAALESGVEGDVHPQAVLLSPERIRVEPGARVDPLAVLDARHGPILIGPDAVVQAHTLVMGPCVVGHGTQLLGGVIGRSTFGPQCRVAGEVEECVWQGFGNKRHHGFLGHSTIGEWVNLGALTTTSDLKNNYGSVRVWVGGREEDSGTTKVGSLIGAHVKTGIGTLLTTGASIGTASNLFGGGRFAPKYLPAFSWWDGEHTIEHRWTNFLRTARIAWSRRGREMGPAEEKALQRVFEATVAERGAVVAGSPGGATG